jgi:RNA polymerase sigma factor (sigma-70 family)
LSVDIESFYERYGPMVLRRCRHLLRNDAQAQDAMQDVFVALLRHQDRLQGEAPSALLLRVATNVCLNRLRTKRRHPEDADDERLLQIAGSASGDGDGRALARDLLAKLFRADDPLAATTHTIAVMHLHDGMTLEEVAREVGLSVSGVRKRLRGARARLSQLEGVAVP